MIIRTWHIFAAATRLKRFRVKPIRMAAGPYDQTYVVQSKSVQLGLSNYIRPSSTKMFSPFPLPLSPLSLSFKTQDVGEMTGRKPRKTVNKNLGRRLPVTSRQLPVTSRQQPFTNCQSPVTNRQSPVASHQ